MKLDKNMRFPLVAVCLTVLICLVLIILPIDQVVTTYKVVNGVQSIVFVPKWEGIVKMLIVSGVIAVAWTWVQKRVEKKISENNNLTSYRIIGFILNLYFFALSTLPAVMGIVSIVIAFSAEQVCYVRSAFHA